MSGKHTKKPTKFYTAKTQKTKQNSAKNQEGVKVEPASKLSLVSGHYLWPKVPDGVDLASAEAEIRHVFGDTPITEASVGAAPPENNIAQWLVHCYIALPEIRKQHVHGHTLCANLHIPPIRLGSSPSLWSPRD